MNKIPISPLEISIVRKELDKCRQDKSALGKKLGKIMSTSGSFATKTPGYSETEDTIRVVEGKISQYNQILNNTTLIKDVNTLPNDNIGIYSKVVAKDENGKLKKYYICHVLNNSIKDALVVTPKSPIGMALIGKKNNDVIQIVLPKGEIKLTIMSHQNIF